MSTPNLPSTNPSTPKARALVVDDIAENREILAYYLGKAGYEVRTTEDGYMALQGLVGGAIMRRSGEKPPQFDIVFMDMQMPNVDGYECVRTLRSKGFRAPIVAVTAHTLTGDREKCLAAGCDDYVGKPFDPQQLLAVSEALLNRARAQAA